MILSCANKFVVQKVSFSPHIRCNSGDILSISKTSLMEKLKEKDCELYNIILQKEKVEPDQMVAMYIGDSIDE